MTAVPIVLPRAVAVRGPARELLGLARERSLLFALVTAFIVAAAVADVVPPLLVRSIVDDHLTPGRVDGLLRLAFLYLAAVAGVQALTFVYAYLAAIAAQRVLRDVRVRLFAHLQRLPVAYHDGTPLGDTISRCTADVETVDTVFSSSVSTLVGGVIRILTVTAAMIVLSPLLAAVSLAILTPVLAFTRYVQVHVRRAQDEYRAGIGQVNGQLQETLVGAEAIHAAAREETFVARFRVALRHALEAYNRAAIYSSLYPTSTGILMAAATGTLLWMTTAGDLYANVGLTVGTLVAFVFLLQRFADPIIELGSEWQTVQEALSGTQRIFEVLAVPEDERPLPARPDAAGLRAGGIIVDHVTFEYRPGSPVLRDVSLHVAVGGQVALVGRTGAGKSSIVQLLAGEYAPQQGVVRIAGVDPRVLSEDDRRRVMGVVPQQVQLFSATVRENLTLGDRDVSEDQLLRAARMAGADAFISALPQGYDTLLAGSGQGRGLQLSAGQRQLLSLARALVWEPRVLLLDEATAAIDGASDAAFRAALRAAGRELGIAVLAVAHRLSTALECDRVVVIEAGEIVEAGTPDELARSGGRFAALIELEQANWEWGLGAAST
jgi:ATP-binding cassette subfamily B protein